MAKERPVLSGRKSGARGRQATADSSRAAGNPQTPGPRRPTSGGPSDPRPIPGPFIPRPATPGDEDEASVTPPAEPGRAEVAAKEKVGTYLTALGTAHVLSRDDTHPGDLHPGDRTEPDASRRDEVRNGDGADPEPPGPADPRPAGRNDRRAGHRDGRRSESLADAAPAARPDTTAAGATTGHETTSDATTGDETTSDATTGHQTAAGAMNGDGTTGPLGSSDSDGSMTRNAPRPSPQSPAGQRAALQHDAEQAALRRAETVGIAKVPPRRPQGPGLQLQPLVHVGDMAASVAFYERLGGELIHGDRDDAWVLMQVGTAQIGLVTRPPDASRGESTVELNFAATMPLDRLEQVLRDHDLQVVKVARDLDLGTQLHIETPDGMPIKIHQVEPDLLV